jgi:hypothetical protein
MMVRAELEGGFEGGGDEGSGKVTNTVEFSLDLI